MAHPQRPHADLPRPDCYPLPGPLGKLGLVGQASSTGSSPPISAQVFHPPSPRFTRAATWDARGVPGSWRGTLRPLTCPRWPFAVSGPSAAAGRSACILSLNLLQQLLPGWSSSHTLHQSAFAPCACAGMVRALPGMLSWPAQPWLRWRTSLVTRLRPICPSMSPQMRSYRLPQTGEGLCHVTACQVPLLWPLRIVGRCSLLGAGWFPFPTGSPFYPWMLMVAARSPPAGRQGRTSPTAVSSRCSLVWPSAVRGLATPRRRLIVQTWSPSQPWRNLLLLPLNGLLNPSIGSCQPSAQSRLSSWACAASVRSTSAALRLGCGSLVLPPRSLRRCWTLPRRGKWILFWFGCTRRQVQLSLESCVGPSSPCLRQPPGCV